MEVLTAAFFFEEAGNFHEEAGGGGLAEAQGDVGPAVTEGGGELLEGAALLGGGQGGEEVGQTVLFAPEDVGHGGGAFAGLEGVVAGEDFVAGEKEFHRLGALEFAPLAGGVLNLGGEGLEFLDFVGEVAEGLGNLIQGGDLILEVAGTAELLDEAAAGGDGGIEQNDGVGFFEGELEVTVGLEFFLGGVPPFFESGGVEDFGEEGGGDLVGGGLAAEVGEDGGDEGNGFLRGLGLHGGGGGGFAGEDVSVGNVLQRLGGVGGLHGMILAAGEIDEDLAGEETPLGDASEAPAFVLTIRAWAEEVKGFGGFGGDLAGIDGLLEFFGHCVLFPMKSGCVQGSRAIADRGRSCLIAHSMSDASPDPAEKERLSEALQRLWEVAAGGPLTIREMIAVMHGRGLLMMVVLICLPFLAPVTIPGISVPFGLAISLCGIRIAFGQKPWLPGFVLDRRISFAVLEKIVRFGCRIAEKLEKIVRPRLALVFDAPGMTMLTGLAIAAAGICLSLPIPPPFLLTNTIPGSAIVLLCIGLMERDGVLVIAGYALTILALVYVGAIALIGQAGVKELWKLLSS